MADFRPISPWLPVVLWAGVISLLSTSWLAADHTGRLLLPLLAKLFPGASPAGLHAMHAAIRKLAHVTEFGVLSVLLYRALHTPLRSRRRAAVLALVLAAGYAVLDELHQHFVPGRTAAAADCLLDTAGAATGQLILAAARARRGAMPSAA
ncbi:MAG: VanZ family protein [Candidatus Binatia bacterium]